MNKPVTFLLAASLVAGCNGNSDSDKKPKDSDSGSPPSSLPSVFINELMASNTASFPDEVGSFEDWIELWNEGNEPADISGWWITDDLDDPFRWQFPEGTEIAAQGYLVLFADEDQAEGPHHLSFQLDADGGEPIGLFGPNVLDNPLVDSLDEILPIETDWSMARQPDGGDFAVDDTPTPGAPNN